MRRPHMYMSSDIFLEKKDLCGKPNLSECPFFGPKFVAFPSIYHSNICLIMFEKRENNVFIHNFSFLQ